MELPHTPDIMWRVYLGVEETGEKTETHLPWVQSSGSGHKGCYKGSGEVVQTGHMVREDFPLDLALRILPEVYSLAFC